jgi:hypothetical protein
MQKFELPFCIIKILLYNKALFTTSLMSSSKKKKKHHEKPYLHNSFNFFLSINKRKSNYTCFSIYLHKKKICLNKSTATTKKQKIYKNYVRSFQHTCSMLLNVSCGSYLPIQFVGWKQRGGLTPPNVDAHMNVQTKSVLKNTTEVTITEVSIVANQFFFKLCSDKLLSKHLVFVIPKKKKK